MSGSYEDRSNRARDRIGTVLVGKYRIDRLLGVGGMAAVFAGTHLRNANCVALKILHRELTLDGELRQRFQREGYAANSVGHPDTVRVLDDDVTQDGSPFLVMDLLEGETLDQKWTRRGRRLHLGEVVRHALALLDVLAAAHAKGIVHRDIKPENLFVTMDGCLKVLDFGIARLAQSAPGTTGKGTVVGSPAFMPPEQALGRSEQNDALSDIWSVGATAFFLLAGRYVHDAETSAEVVVRTATRPAPRLASVAPWVPAPVAEVIDRALAYERSQRWPDARSMREALMRARDGLPAEVLATPGDADAGPARASSLEPLARNPDGTEFLAPGAIRVPAYPVGSTVAGLASATEARRIRSRRRLLFGGTGAAGLIVVAAIAVTSFTQHAEVPTPHASLGTTDVRGAAAAPPTAEAIPSPSASSPSPPSVSVETLPRAATDGTTAGARVATVPAQATSVAHPSAHPSPVPAATPAHRPTRDPLAPW
jgi:eukaryotic-like serine/threonine-protein kinase